ncbi:hypothetical protein J2752_002666 [Halarchaeum rubridurum]|uniref:DUF6788 domain-containing protein n=1 Tax=Halarchaeum rubridurum TaxID=489911 RepID=A0A830G3I0_9EURY|nr:hypothetical protein [Halarchaeum rubridurum]MBP1955737.1 hypothetical protein [Halarchaeum rubridurum]GGM73815.1 hypothetical protein GCM10009017_24670 [Halarchaeum rubridurum]
MSDSPPKPPQKLSRDLVESIECCSAEELRAVERYADALTQYRERETRLTEENQDEVEDRPKELPDDVPTRATLTTKEINGNRYYYWQWRDGEKVRSRYKGPVSGDDEETG